MRRKLIELCDKTGDLDDTSEYQLLIRLLKERTILDDDGARRLRKKEEVENPSEVLLNPSDPEATFRYKAGEKTWATLEILSNPLAKRKPYHGLRIREKYLC